MAQRLDKLHLEGFWIFQDGEKFCYGIDAVLLADFALRSLPDELKFPVEEKKTGGGLSSVEGMCTAERQFAVKGALSGRELSPVEGEDTGKGESSVEGEDTGRELSPVEGEDTGKGESSVEGEFRVFDLGSGNGIIPILLAAKTSGNVKITGVEIQPEMAAMARRSVEVNGLEGRIEIFEGDIKQVEANFLKGCAEAVVSNPPYMVASRGRQGSNFSKMVARQEILCCLEDIVRAADFLLAEGGKFFMIHRPERLEEIFVLLEKFCFGKVVWRPVKPFEGKGETMVLVLAEKCGSRKKNGLEKCRLEDLIIYETGDPRRYTAEVLEIYGRKNEHQN